jgi:cytochrome c-type biogenesis protein CcmF
MFLTVGIALGSWWAYYELGWGGFWFWDPVENASFMPWLFAAALMHSAIVVEKRESLKSWTILLAILAFGFSLIGTFIVRSGVLTSVHAFASDPERGMMILFILAFFVGGALTLFAARANAMQAKGVFGLVSRESGLLLNNIILAVSSFVVFIGTIWPLIAEMFFDRKLSVGAPFFNQAFSPFMILLGIALPIGAMLPWKRANLSATVRKLIPAMGLALAVALLGYVMQTGRSLLGPVGLLLGTWIVVGTAIDLWSRTGRKGSFARLFRLPRADWGKSIAHAGLGVTMLGVSGLMAWELEDISTVQIGESVEIGSYEVTLTEVKRVQGPNYMSTMASVDVHKNGSFDGTLHPEKRVYPVQAMPTTEAAIDNGFLRDVYVVIGDPQANGGWALRSHVKPLANWIWGGSILMALGGIFSLTDRRYRVAAGARKAQTAGVPAE